MGDGDVNVGDGDVNVGDGDVNVVVGGKLDFFVDLISLFLFQMSETNVV